MRPAIWIPILFCSSRNFVSCMLISPLLFLVILYFTPRRFNLLIHLAKSTVDKPCFGRSVKVSSQLESLVPWGLSLLRLEVFTRQRFSLILDFHGAFPTEYLLRT